MPQAERALVPVAQRDGYLIGLESYAGQTFGHIEFSKPATAQRLRQARRDIDAIVEMHGGPILAMSRYSEPRDVRKHAKFVAMMGFQFHAMVPCMDGIDRPLYIRS